MPEESCLNCRWSFLDSEGILRCRYNPPQVISNTLDGAVYPARLQHADVTCSHYKPKAHA